MQLFKEFLILSLITAPTALVFGQAPAPAVHSIEEVQLKWRSRENRFSIINLKWHERLSDFRTASGSDAFTGGAAVNKRQAQIQYDRRIALHGTRLRFDDGMPHRHSKSSEFGPNEMTWVDNDKASKMLATIVSKDGFPFQGDINTAGSASKKLRSLTELQPIFDYIRPSWRLSGVLAKSKITGRLGEINGRQCVITETRRRSGNSWVTYSLWLDPTLDYAVRRIIEDLDGRIIMQQDRDYNGAIGMLSGWKIVENTPNGEIERAITSEVLASESTGTVDDDLFTLAFPPGTVIIDHTSKGNSSQVVRGDNSTRTISHSELLHKSPQEILSEGSGYGIVTMLIVLALMAITAILVLNRRLLRFPHL